MNRRGCAAMRMLCGALLVLCALAAPAQAAEPRYGVIRWDNWYPGSPHAKVLADGAAQDRLPFYAARSDDGRLELAGDAPNVASAEIDYAKAAGIDYWIFGHYLPTPTFGHNVAQSRAIAGALEAYLSLPDRRGLKYAISLNWAPGRQDFDALVDLLERSVTHPDYVATDDGRAPVFVFVPNAQRWLSAQGNAERARDFYARVGDAVRQATRRDLYWVVLAAAPDVGERLAASVGFDATSAYLYSSGTPHTGKRLSYAECAVHAQRMRQAGADGRLAYLPNVTLGWDYRPILEHPGELFGRTATPNWCEPARRGDWRTQLGDAQRIAALPKNAAFRSIVIYAWNEFSEGGWLAPTIGLGTRYLGELREALGRPEPEPEPVVLQWRAGPGHAPLADWPCPPGLPAVSDRREDGERFGTAGRWVTRRCAPSD